MGTLFSGRELINIGIGIEKNGVAYYGTLADCAQDDAAKATYGQLADKEREHIQTFESMLSTAGDYQPPETFTEEYEAYVKALVDSLVFTDEQQACDLAQSMSSNAQALQTAIMAEKDSILFYLEMRDLIRSSERYVVDSLIAEEKKHLRELAQLRRSLSA